MPSPSSPTSNPDLKVAKGAIVCAEAILQGDITIGAGSIVHPKAQILAEAGPIILGENNLVEENAIIVNRHSSPDNQLITLTIGDSNVFEIGSRTECVTVGDNNVVEVRAIVGPDVDLTSGCVIGAGCEVLSRAILPDHTVIYGSQCQRFVARDKPQVQHSQLEYLRKALPNFHYLATKKSP